MTLPTDPAARKALPLYDFMFGYFPDAWLEVVKVAVAGNKQHLNGSEKIRWAREKSTDQMNTAFRHLFDHGAGAPIDTDGTRHLAKAIWRLMAQLQLDLEDAKLPKENGQTVREFLGLNSYGDPTLVCGKKIGGGICSRVPHSYGACTNGTLPPNYRRLYEDGDLP